MGVVLSRLHCCMKKETHHSEALEDSELFFSLRTLEVATNFFSDLNLLGHGGFGPVYKGFIPNGQEIAVKKLSVNSRQGLTEFTNEVKLLLKIQHKNLVTLLGCCIDADEKMLVYEYQPNKSLDYFLFNKEKSHSLDWGKRYRIIAGIARGLLYLHEEAPERIIHRDVKASNILLDEHLNPKISDFGLARLFPGDDTHMDTVKISGTYGYMAPEYAMHGYLSVKSDVFSFGILMLEIVSGRKNFADHLGADKADLLSYTWMLFQEGKALKLVDANLAKFNPDEVAMCIQLGLLCCQATVTDRPTMTQSGLIDFVPGRCVSDAAQRKYAKYRDVCSAAGYGFLPFSFSSFGELEADGILILGRIRSFCLSHDTDSRDAAYIFTRVCFAIAKGVCAQLVSRLPANFV